MQPRFAGVARYFSGLYGSVRGGRGALVIRWRGIELRDLTRPDASGISSEKAKRLLGWKPTRSWRDYLDENGTALAR